MKLLFIIGIVVSHFTYSADRGMLTLVIAHSAICKAEVKDTGLKIF